MKPTAEQAAIVDAARTGAHLVIEAGAGTGKTSTLKLLARAKPNSKGVYLAYNKSIAVDAQRAFPTTVVCKTAHAFAYAEIGRLYADRLSAPRQPARVTADLLGIRQPLHLGDDVPKLAPQQIARMVMSTVDRFCQSADPLIGRKHVPVFPGFEADAARAELARAILPYAKRAWEDITRLRGRLRFTHDSYLKIWQLSVPNLRADYVLLDEAQDSNPAVAAVVEGQQAQRILVGDRCQAIYGWRGAVDAMENFDGARFYLSQSFRFGPAVAAEANKWLGLLDAQLRLRGLDTLDSQVGFVDLPDAVLCRSNGGALGRVISALSDGRRVALVGGGQQLRAYAEAAEQLMRGEPCSHPELLAFSHWNEVRDYAAQDAGGNDLKVVVDLIDKHGPAEIVRLTGLLANEDQADVVVSTAHKAKGREWRSVLIADDFREPRPHPETGEVRVLREDAMLAYVAVTRARERLDRDGLSWVDSYVGPNRPSVLDGIAMLSAFASASAPHPEPTKDSPPDPALVPRWTSRRAAGAVEEAVPAPRHPGTCIGACDDVFPDRCLWPAPLPVGAR